MYVTWFQYYFNLFPKCETYLMVVEIHELHENEYLYTLLIIYPLFTVGHNFFNIIHYYVQYKTKRCI